VLTDVTQITEIDLTQITLDEEAGRALVSTSNQVSTPVKWHGTQNKGMQSREHSRECSGVLSRSLE